MEDTGMLDPADFYNPESKAFPDLAKRFAISGRLTGEELYLILDWKAPRARTNHLKRLTKQRTFEQAAAELSEALTTAEKDEDRLRLLMQPPWSFRLPTATAILAVLYPERFTVYDVRVCSVLDKFGELDGRAWSDDTTWRSYLAFMTEVRKAAPEGKSLRDADRWLWGKDKQLKLRQELGL